VKIGKLNKKTIILIVAVLLATVPWFYFLTRCLDQSDISGQPVNGNEISDDSQPTVLTDPEDSLDSKDPLDSEDSQTDPNDTPEDQEPPTEASQPSLPGQPDTEPPTEVLTEPVTEAPTEPLTEPPSAEAVYIIADEFPSLASELNKIASRYNCAAVSLVLYDGDAGEYYAYQYGNADIRAKRPVDVDTMFRIASLSKLTTVICAMVLVDEGRLDLDEDISVYLGYEVRNPNSRGTPVTSRMLMQHTSSIFDSSTFQVSRDRNSSESTQRLLTAGSSFRSRQPGAGFQYSNFGFAVLGAVCEMISGKTLDTLAREVLFEPLGIDAAYVPGKLHDTGNIAVIYNSNHSVTRSVQAQLDIRESDKLGYDQHLAQGNLTISAVDFSRILAMLGNGGSLNGVWILSPESVAAIHDTNVRGAAYEQGLATRFMKISFMPGDGAYWHTGSGSGTFTQYIYSGDGTNRGVVVLTTGSNTGRASSGMVNVCTDLSAMAWKELGFG